MSKESTRDLSMYQNLDPEYIKELKRELRKKKLGLNDHIPNNLRRDQSMSAISTADVGSGLLQKNRSK